MANKTRDDGSPETRPSPWHEGERALHERIGLADKMERAGRHSLRDAMADQHRFFFAQLLLVGSVDDQGWPWASLLAGLPGFASSPDPRRLDIDVLPPASQHRVADFRHSPQISRNPRRLR